MTKRDELIALGGIGVKVRELEWPPRCPRGQRVHNRPALVNYTVAHYGGDVGDAIYRWAEAHSPWSDPLPTYETAKAAAQADYETRILSALEAPAAGSNFDGYDVRFHENVLGQLGATTKSDGDEPSSRTAGGFPVAAAPYHAEETGVIQPTRERAGIERGMDQGVTGGESATTNSSPSEPKNYFFENEEDAAEAADNGRNTGGKSYYRPSDPSSTRSDELDDRERDYALYGLREEDLP